MIYLRAYFENRIMWIHWFFILVFILDGTPAGYLLAFIFLASVYTLGKECLDAIQQDVSRLPDLRNELLNGAKFLERIPSEQRGKYVAAYLYGTAAYPKMPPWRGEPPHALKAIENLSYHDNVDYDSLWEEVRDIKKFGYKKYVDEP